MAQTTRRTIIDLSDFRPTPTQQAFMDSRAPRVLFSGGFGAGKTAANVEKVIDLALENPGMPGIMVSASYPMLDKTMLVEFEKRMPKALIVKHNTTKHWFKLRNGSTIYYGSADNPDSLDGPTLAWASCDEIRLWKRKAWDITVGRVRLKEARRRQIIATSTPQMGWMYDEFGAPKEGNETFTASTRENATNLAPGYIRDLENTYSKRLAKALIDGQFTLQSGAVYEEFDEARHVIDWPHLPSAETFLGVDFGIVSPAVVVAQIAPFDVPLSDGRIIPTGSIVIVDEAVPDQTPTIRLAPVIQRLPHYRPGMVAHVDPAGGARSQAEGRDSHAILRDEARLQVRFSTAPEERYVPNGIALVKQALDPIDGPPVLYVSREVAARKSKRGCLATMRGYRYPEKDGRQTSDQPVKDGVVDHYADALRYLVVGSLRDRRSLGSEMLQRTMMGFAMSRAA